MILLLVLGLIACLYLIGLLMACILHALPIGIAIAAGFWLHAHGAGISLAILGAVVTGLAISSAGPWMLAQARSPVARLFVMLLFAFPAGIAGHQMVYGLGRLLLVDGALLSLLAALGGIVIACMAGRRLAFASGCSNGPTC